MEDLNRDQKQLYNTAVKMVDSFTFADEAANGTKSPQGQAIYDEWLSDARKRFLHIVRTLPANHAVYHMTTLGAGNFMANAARDLAIEEFLE